MPLTQYTGQFRQFREILSQNKKLKKVQGYKPVAKPSPSIYETLGLMPRATKWINQLIKINKHLCWLLFTVNLTGLPSRLRCIPRWVPEAIQRGFPGEKNIPTIPWLQPMDWGLRWNKRRKSVQTFTAPCFLVTYTWADSSHMLPHTCFLVTYTWAHSSHMLPHRHPSSLWWTTSHQTVKMNLSFLKLFLLRPQKPEKVINETPVPTTSLSTLLAKKHPQQISPSSQEWLFICVMSLKYTKMRLV